MRSTSKLESGLRPLICLLNIITEGNWIIYCDRIGMMKSFLKCYLDDEIPIFLQ